MSSLWLGFIIFIAVGLLIFGILIHYKSSFYIKMLDNLQQNNSSSIKKVKTLQKDITLIQMQGKLYKEVLEANNILKESIQNMFDLIPDQITLQKVVMEKKSLFLRGYTDSAESYKLLLEPPLKSIFTQTKVKFSKDEKGRMIFESFSSIDEQLSLEDVNETK
jgi:Tfp pilus assembly protein PilN